MPSPRLRSRLAAAAAAGLLVTGLAGVGLPGAALAAKPATARLVPLSRLGKPLAASAPVSRGRVNAARLVGPAPKAAPFSRSAVDRTLDSVRARALAARKSEAGRLKPNSAQPAPDPDLWQTSGAPAASVASPGVGARQLSAGNEPADASTAAGPDQVLEAVNGAIYFADRSGGLVGQQAISTSDFFRLPEPGNGSAFETFDSSPRVVYDATVGRWYASEVSWNCATDTFPGDTATFGHGHIEFAISDGPNALGTWTLGTITLNDLLPDQPTFALSSDKLAFTADASAMQAGGGPGNPGCIGGGPTGELLNVIDRAELAPGFTTWRPFGVLVGDPFVWLRPVLQEPVSSPDLRFIGAVNENAPLEVATIAATGSARNNTLDGVTYDLSSDGVVPPFLDPAPPREPGPATIAQAVDARPTAAVEQSGILAIGSTYPCTPDGDSTTRDCVRVTTLSETAGYLEPTRLGDVLLATNGLDQYQPAIAFAGSGVLHAVYTGSSTSQDPSGYAQYHRRNDPFQTWSDPQIVVAGTDAYGGNRWGDYSLAGQDPQDPNRIWVSPEYGSDSGTWATAFSSIAATQGAGLQTIDPVRLVDTRLGIGISGPLMSGLPRQFPLPVANQPQFVALTGNLTITGASAPGYLSLSGDPSTTSSTINFRAGETRANNVTVPIGRAGLMTAILHAGTGGTAQLILDVTGLFADGSGSGFFPISPVRVLDTRSTPGAAFRANLAQSIQVAGRLSIPSDATAISANLTATNVTNAGYVSVTTKATNSPSTSTLNLAAGDTRANGLTLPLASDGTIAAVYKAPSGSSADLILDVTGYYSNDPGGLLFHPLNPGRLVDTRQPLGPGSYLNGLTGAQGTTPRSVQVNGHYGVPADAQAVTGNLTITGQTAPGFVTVEDVAVAKPATSTINFPLGDTRANGLTVPVDDHGRLWFVDRTAAGQTVQLVFDVSGYFEAPAS